MSVIVTEMLPRGVADADMRVGTGVTWVYPPCIVAGTFAVPATPAGVVVACAILTLVAAAAPTVFPEARLMSSRLGGPHM
jgi:hypothetical protein